MWCIFRKYCFLRNEKSKNERRSETKYLHWQIASVLRNWFFSKFIASFYITVATTSQRVISDICNTVYEKTLNVMLATLDMDVYECVCVITYSLLEKHLSMPHKSDEEYRSLHGRNYHSVLSREASCRKQISIRIVGHKMCLIW